MMPPALYPTNPTAQAMIKMTATIYNRFPMILVFLSCGYFATSKFSKKLLNEIPSSSMSSLNSSLKESQLFLFKLL